MRLSFIGRWVKIDSHQVPKLYFKYLIRKIGVQINSVRQVCHKAQPRYQGATLKISYKLFSLDELVSALEGQDLVSLHKELRFAANEICEDGNARNLSAEEEIAQAKVQVFTPVQNKRKRPSSKSSLTVG